MTKIYSNQKFLQFPDRLEAIRDRRVVAPVHVRIKPMNHCNHDCWYCAYRVSNLQLGEDIDLKDTIPEDKMFEIVDNILDMGVEAVTFSGGGEPLIYKPLPEVIRRLAEGGVRVASLTNGSNLKGHVADAFAEHATWVRISIDSWDDKSYAESRKLKIGAFTQVIENIRSFTARGSDCVLGASFITSKDNVEHIFEACEILKDAGVDHVKIAATVISNDARENNLYHREIWEEATAQIERAQKLNDQSFTLVNHYHETEERFEKNYDFCPFLNFLTVIGADQKVYTCQDKAYNEMGLLGSIKERSFKTFWFSDENREKMYQLDPSVSCQHHCVAHTKNLAIMDYLSIDPEHGRFV